MNSVSQLDSYHIWNVVNVNLSAIEIPLDLALVSFRFELSEAVDFHSRLILIADVRLRCCGAHINIRLEWNTQYFDLNRLTLGQTIFILSGTNILSTVALLSWFNFEFHCCCQSTFENWSPELNVQLENYSKNYEIITLSANFSIVSHCASSECTLETSFGLYIRWPMALP